MVYPFRPVQKNLRSQPGILRSPMPRSSCMSSRFQKRFDLIPLLSNLWRSEPVTGTREVCYLTFFRGKLCSACFFSLSLSFGPIECALSWISCGSFHVFCTFLGVPLVVQTSLEQFLPSAGSFCASSVRHHAVWGYIIGIKSVVNLGVM